jgi:hypothetical protein
MIEDVLKAHAQMHEASSLLRQVYGDLGNPAKLDAAKMLMAKASAAYEAAYADLTPTEISRLAQVLMASRST